MATEVRWTEGTIQLRSQEVPVKHGQMPQECLSFYSDNPRIYTMVGRSEGIPSQDDIETALSKMDHVKDLVQSIRMNGGLMDPILVRDGDNVVLEGNSRLAAYRILGRLDPIRWGLIRVTLLPADISDDLVFALLGQYHLIGKKDWQPYEQAGYFYRRHMGHGIAVATIASEMGLSKQKIQHLINTYTLMVKHNETSTERWSYYDEYLKSAPIKKARQENPGMDECVVAKIRSGEIGRAIDIREKLSVVAKAGGKHLRTFLREDDSFDKAFEMTADRSEWYSRLNRFKKQIGAAEQELRALSAEQRKKCAYELKQIQRIVQTILPKL